MVGFAERADSSRAGFRRERVAQGIPAAVPVLGGFDQSCLGEFETLGFALAGLRQGAQRRIKKIVAGAAADCSGFARGSLGFLGLPWRLLVGSLGHTTTIAHRRWTAIGSQMHKECGLARMRITGRRPTLDVTPRSRKEVSHAGNTHTLGSVHRVR
jgi:hypothetical protein